VAIVPPREDPEADVLGPSSERWLALDVRRRIDVVAWTATSANETQFEAEQYLRGIYEGPADGAPVAPGPQAVYHYRGATSEHDLLGRLQQRTRDPLDLVVLANVVPRDERLVAALRDFVHEGGGLLVFVGDRSSADGLNMAFHADDPQTRLLPFPYEPAQVRDRGDRTQAHFSLDLAWQADPHPLAANFTNVEAKDWLKQAPPMVWGRMPFDEGVLAPGPGDGSDATGTTAEAPGEVVLRFEPGPDGPGKPAVVAGRFGEGRTLWVATSLDNGWLARPVFFVPSFLMDASLYLTRPAGAGRNLDLGGILRVTAPADAEQVRIVPPDGGALTPTRRTGADRSEEQGTTRVEYEFEGVGRRGIWRATWETTSGAGEPERVVEAFAVNVDPEEGLLASARRSDLADETLSRLDLVFLDSYGDVGSEIEEAREGELSRLLLYLLLGVLLLESVLAMALGRRASPPASPRGRSSGRISRPPGC
jgi:hypothetical protein